MQLFVYTKYNNNNTHIDDPSYTGILYVDTIYKHSMF